MVDGNAGSKFDPFSMAISLPLARAYADMGLNEYNKIAEQYRLAMENGEIPPFDGSSAIAAASVLALSAELLFKVARFQTTGAYPKGHDLLALVKLLSDDEIKFLRAAFTKLLEENENILSVKIELLPEGAPPASGPLPRQATLTFDEAVSIASPLFVKLRYVYENAAVGFDATVDFRCLLPLVNSLLALVEMRRGGGSWTLSFGDGVGRGFSHERGDFGA